MKITDIDTIVHTISQLIQFRSTADRPQEREAALNYVKDFFRDTPYTIEIFERNGIKSAYISKGNPRPKVMLYAHYDVVEGNDEQFLPIISDGKLIGRGAFDMKCGMAVFMHIMKDLADQDHDVGLILVGDEENGGPDGSGFVVPQGYCGDVVFMPDGGMNMDTIIAKEKGVMRLTLEATGIAAHGSAVWKGTNAIDKLIEAIKKVQALFPAIEDHPEDHWVSTMNIGVITGGTAVNQVADQASALCDVRLIDGISPMEMFDKIDAVMPEGTVMKRSISCPAQMIPMEHPLVTTAEDILKEVDRTPVHGIAHGSSDARYFLEQGGIPLIFQPDGGGHHSAHEWVSIDAIAQYDKMVRAYISRVG